MAENGALEHGTATGADYVDYKRTYDGFVRVLKICTAVALVVLALMAFFLT